MSLPHKLMRLSGINHWVLCVISGEEGCDLYQLKNCYAYVALIWLCCSSFHLFCCLFSVLIFFSFSHSVCLFVHSFWPLTFACSFFLSFILSLCALCVCFWIAPFVFLCFHLTFAFPAVCDCICFPVLPFYCILFYFILLCWPAVSWNPRKPPLLLVLLLLPLCASLRKHVFLLLQGISPEVSGITAD